MKLFNYTPWEVLETYEYGGTWYCVQVRMNRSNGFKRFKVSRITGHFHSAHCTITSEKIEQVLR